MPIIGVQCADLMNNILIVLKLGHKLMLQFFIHALVGSCYLISSIKFRIVTLLYKNWESLCNYNGHYAILSLLMRWHKNRDTDHVLIYGDGICP